MANNITVKDALSANQVVKTTDTAGVHTPHQNVDSLPPIPIGANHIGEVTAVGAAADGAAVSGNPVLVAGFDGVNVQTLLTNASGNLQVTALDGGGALTVDDGGGSLTVDGTVAVSSMPVADQGLPNTAGNAWPHYLTNAGGGTTASVGTAVPATSAGGLVVREAQFAAHDTAVAGSPRLQGAEARTTDGSPVNTGDAVRLIADTLGKQVVLQGAIHDLQSNGTTNYTTTTAADVIAAAGAGVRIAVTSLLVTNAHVTVGTKVEIRDGTTVKILGLAAAAGGGFSLNAGGRPLFISTANAAVTARCVTTGADVDVSISGYRIAN